MQFFKDLLKTYLGPALVAGVIILGWWAWNDIKIKEQGMDAFVQQTSEISGVLSNQCKAVLERQGFVVEPKGAEAKAEDPAASIPDKE